MRTTKRNRNARFFSGMLYVALAVILLTALFCAFIYLRLAAYERSRPSFAVSSYQQTLTEEHISSLAEELLENTDMNQAQKEENIRAIRDALRGASWNKNIAETTDDRLSYILKYEGRPVANVVFAKAAKSRMGYTPWALFSEQLMESGLKNRVQCTVPTGFSVEINDRPLGREYIADSNVPYPQYDGFYDLGYNFPVMKKYDTGEFFGACRVKILDRDGNEVPESAIDEFTAPTECTESEKRELTELMTAFIEKYVAYKSCAVNTPSYNMQQAAAYCVPGSDMTERLQLALGGLTYASSNGDTVTGTDVHDCIRAENGMYVCSVDYTVHTTGSDYTETTHTYSSRFLVEDTADGMKIVSECTY